MVPKFLNGDHVRSSYEASEALTEIRHGRESRSSNSLSPEALGSSIDTLAVGIDGLY